MVPSVPWDGGTAVSDRNGNPTPIKSADPRYLEGVSEIDDDMTDPEWLATYGPFSCINPEHGCDCEGDL